MPSGIVVRSVRRRLSVTRRKVLELSASRLAKSYALPTIKLDALVPGSEVEIEPRIPEQICLPPMGTKQHDDFTPLMKIARSLDAALIVELGTAHGNTVANLCRQCPAARVFTVNAPATQQTGRLTTFALTVEEIGSVYRSHGYGPRVTQLFENTLKLDLSRHCTEGSVDLAVIDACHDTRYVINDFERVYPYVKRRGIVLLHDTHPSMSGHLIGSYTACMQLRKRGFDIRHLEDTWWGVWSPEYRA